MEDQKRYLERRIIARIRLTAAQEAGRVGKAVFRFCIALSVVWFSFLYVGQVQAAQLGVVPSSASVHVGETFFVDVIVSSPDQAINAFDGVITFPSDVLEFVSFSSGSSIASFWIQMPVYSDMTDTMSFQGIVLNPGFQGERGMILRANFRAKTSESAVIRILSGSVLANDGQGTNILTSFFNGAVTVSSMSVKQSTIPSPIVPKSASSTSPASSEGSISPDAESKKADVQPAPEAEIEPDVPRSNQKQEVSVESAPSITSTEIAVYSAKDDAPSLFAFAAVVSELPVVSEESVDIREGINHDLGGSVDPNAQIIPQRIRDWGIAFVVILLLASCLLGACITLWPWSRVGKRAKRAQKQMRRSSR